MPYYLSDETYTQLERVIQLSESSEDGGVMPLPQKAAKQVCFVLVTSGSSSPYTGTVQVMNNDGSITSYSTSAKLWNINSSSLTVGQSYQSLRTGNDGSGNPQYVTSVSVPASPSCTSQSWTAVTNSCPIISSGVQTGTMVELTTFTLTIVDGCPVISAGTQTCTTNPGGCCSGTESATCGTCDLYPASWNAVITGVTTGTDGCSGSKPCSAINGTWTLTDVGYVGSCVWTCNMGTICGVGDCIITLEYSSGAWIFTIDIAGIETLPLVGEFNCFGINTFYGPSEFAENCGGTDITVVISPA